MTTLLIGGRIYSPTHPDATAMAVRGDVVAWLGSDQVGRAQFPDARVVDLDGAFVAPAFVDSHVHLTATGLTRLGLDLRGATSKAHCLQLVADYVATAVGGGHDVIWGHGWDDSGWPDASAPTVAELDAAVGSRPAYLTRIDAHSALASSALRDRVPELAGAAGFDAAGPLSAEAHHLVRAQARALLRPAQRDEARRSALDAFAAAGVVAVHECAGPNIGGLDDWREVQAIRHGVEVTGYWGEAVTSADEARALIETTGAHGLAGDLFVDGALGSRTAWLHEPYHDAPDTCGNGYLSEDALTAHLSACTEARVTAGFHVIGDRAVSAAVHAFARVAEAHGVAAVARCGHRLEHLEMVTPEQATALGGWGVIGSVQPGFDARWGGPAGMYAQRLGVARAEQLNPFALLASQGVPLAFGSDAPVTCIDPWGTVRAATAHHTPGSSISPRAAFAAATRGGWRAAGVRDGVTGTLAPGAVASYAVWEVGELAVAAPADAVQRWSTEPGSRVPGLPRLGAGEEPPRCLQTVHRGTVIFGAADG